MVLNSIEKLLEKYDNGETTLKEEERLKAYFTQDDVAPHLESYKVMFQYFNDTKQEAFTKEVSLELNQGGVKKSYIYQWIAVAAVAVLMLGIFIPNIWGEEPSQSYADLSEEQQKAIDQTKEVFDLIGTQFNKGQSQMGVLSLTSSNFSKGAEQVEYISEISETTNKFFKSKKKK
ncbi:MAG: hypothetical protein WA775_15315 [Psychroserpens sp.]|uniref:hypothetical protein n=1 Tax=Psychroserpens sp. TaxID=2020870 RepID=UPI003C785F3B